MNSKSALTTALDIILSNKMLNFYLDLAILVMRILGIVAIWLQ